MVGKKVEPSSWRSCEVLGTAGYKNGLGSARKAAQTSGVVAVNIIIELTDKYFTLL